MNLVRQTLVVINVCGISAKVLVQVSKNALGKILRTCTLLQSASAKSCALRGDARLCYYLSVVWQVVLLSTRWKLCLHPDISQPPTSHHRGAG